MRKRRERKYNPKFFPFSAGIPWKIERGKYIIPEIDLETWHQVIEGKNITLVAFGGLIESFFSLSAAEVLFSIDPIGSNIFWLGDFKYSSFMHMQNLCKPSTIDLTPQVLRKYPTPIFFDRHDNVYFNLLNNYLIRKSYWNQYPENINDAALKQIFKNVMVDWKDYIPKMRLLGDDFFQKTCQTGRLTQRSRFILIILDDEVRGMDMLGWNIHNLKELSQLVRGKGLKVIVFTNNVRKFYGTNILAFEYNIKNILQFINKSWMVLSNNIDWILISLMTSRARLVSRQHIKESFDLFKNAEFLGVENEIFVDNEDLSPMDVYNICSGSLL